jgi:hypothetical protein
MCDTKSSCGRCGWHPQEEKRRLKMIRNGEMSVGPWGKKKLRIKKKIG